MPSFDDSDLMDALSAPVGNLISSVGRSVAQAQLEMDRASITALQELYGSDEDIARMLQNLGYRPTWYHIPEVDTELTVALTVTGERTEQGGGTPGATAARAPVKMYAAPVDATYTNKYGFELKASSRVRFKVVPVPPSVAAEQMLVVPQLVGMSLEDARRLLMQLNIPMAEPSTDDDAAVVEGQEPAAGSVLGPGGEVALTFPGKQPTITKK